MPCFGTPKHAFEYESMAPIIQNLVIICERGHLGSSRRTKGKSKTIDAGTTTGTARPMPASAEPIAGFMLLCRRFARAARTAAHVSGNSTSVAARSIH